MNIYKYVEEHEEDQDILYVDVDALLRDAIIKLQRENPDCYVKLIGKIRSKI